MINVTDKGLVTLHQWMSPVGDSIAIAAQQMLGSPRKTVHLKEEEGSIGLLGRLGKGSDNYGKVKKMECDSL